MKLSEWASVAEITSALVVVVSLVYVGFQISQNTAAVKASTHLGKLCRSRPEMVEH